MLVAATDAAAVSVVLGVRVLFFVPFLDADRNLPETARNFYGIYRTLSKRRIVFLHHVKISLLLKFIYKNSGPHLLSSWLHPLLSIDRSTWSNLQKATEIFPS